MTLRVNRDTQTFLGGGGDALRLRGLGLLLLLGRAPRRKSAERDRDLRLVLFSLSSSFGPSAAFKSTGGSSPGGAGSASGSVKLLAAGAGGAGFTGTSAFGASLFESRRSSDLLLSRSRSRRSSERPPPRPPPRPRLSERLRLRESFLLSLDRDREELELELELLEDPLEDEELLLDEPLELLELSRLFLSRLDLGRSFRDDLSIFFLSGDESRLLELELRRPGMACWLRSIYVAKLSDSLKRSGDGFTTNVCLSALPDVKTQNSSVL